MASSVMSTLTPSPAMASLPAPAATTLTPPTLPASNIPENMMFKKLLHNYTQKASLPIPVYQSFNEGSAHWPRFRSTVLVGEEQFVSSNVFLHRKEADHDAAKIALECIEKRGKEEEIPIAIILEGSIFCKSILNEYAGKRQMEMPVYKTIPTQGSLPVFISSVVFNGVTYTGENARTKKEAEQLAARALILAIINGGDPTSSAIVSEIIKSKSRFYENKKSLNVETNDNAPIIAVSQAAPEFHPPQQLFTAVTTGEAVEKVTKLVEEEEEEVRVKPPSETVDKAPDIPRHAFAIPKVEAIKDETQLPIAFVPPMIDPSPDVRKRKKRNKRKSKKKMCRGILVS